MRDDKISFDEFLKSDDCLPDEPRRRERAFKGEKHKTADFSFIALVIVAAVSIALTIMFYKDVFMPIDNDYTFFLGSNSSQAGQTDGEKININTASVETLCTLNYIGERKAIEIVAYRIANGPFEKIEDIINVNTIGESIFNKIKDDICV